MSLPEDFLEPGDELEETHISWVYLRGDEVWKIKKPVDLGFLDFRALDGRHRACEAELRLNRRLAPEVYRSVEPLRRGSDGTLTPGGDGEIVEWAVRMKRMPERERADVLLAKGRLGDDEIVSIAAQLSRFHEACGPSEQASRFGSSAAFAVNVRENFEQTRDTVTEYLSSAQASEIESWQTDFLEGHAASFDERIRLGRVREGHGDLRLEHVYLNERDGVRVLDCIEFNERFRVADVAADLVFLAMDLASAGRVDLAERLLARYALESNDYGLFPLVDFYESYRAFVRAKIASFVAAAADTTTGVREKARRQARRFFLLALASERRALVPPALIVLCGAMASGKSTVAEGLSRRLSIPVVVSDRTRKDLAGVEAAEPVRAAPFEGVYGSGMTDRTYEEMLSRADGVLRSGRSVVLDASFRARRHREAARALAAERGVPFALVECRASPQVLAARLEARAAGPSVSDGRAEIQAAVESAWQPVTELAAEEHVVLVTEAPLDVSIESLEPRLPLPFSTPRD